MKFQESLGMRLRVAYLTFHRRAQAILADYGVTADQFVVLSLLAEEDDVTQGRLVEQCGSDSSTIAAMLKLLERDGLVRRSRHPGDGRALLIELTGKGRRREQRLAEVVAPLRKEFNDAVAPENLDVVQGSLERMADAMRPTRVAPARN